MTPSKIENHNRRDDHIHFCEPLAHMCCNKGSRARTVNSAIACTSKKKKKKRSKTETMQSAQVVIVAPEIFGIITISLVLWVLI